MSDTPWNLGYFIPTAPPDVPTALPATAVTGAGFTANWTAVARASRYRLDVSTDPAFADFVDGYEDLAVVGLSTVLLGLEEGTTYYYRVRAENPYDTSESSNTVDTFTDFIEAPVATAATDILEDGFVAHWEPVAEAVSYELDVSADADFETLEPVNVVVDVGNVTEYRVQTLAPDTQYFYRVRAVKASGVISVSSNVIDVTTLELFVGQGGDLVLFDGEYSTHVFDNSDDFEVLQGLGRVRRLLVAGGGQGGGINGTGVSAGGGGGGGVRDLDFPDRDPIGVDVYPVVVGAGGSVAGLNNVGESGHDSTFDGDTAIGGGFGGSSGAAVGNGGSGGGAPNSSGTEAAGTGTAGQGTAGGSGNAGSGGGGGGGGAAQAGANGTAVTGGKGGDGIASDILDDDDNLYGAGGGGARPVNAFGVIAATTPGLGGASGPGTRAGDGVNATPATGLDATGIGAGGGGALGNRAGGHGTKGRVVLKYRGRAADITPPPADPTPPRGPILFTGCTRLQVVDGVNILIDSNSKNNTGIYPDYRQYRCVGGGVVQSSRWDIAYGPTLGNDGILVFRFSQPIRKFIITRRVTADVEAIPTLIACDDYTVIPSPSSSPPGSSQDGSIVGRKTQSPRNVYYPVPGLEPPVNLAAEEEMSVEWADGFSCVVIVQGPDSAPVRTSEFIDPYFILLSD